MRILDVVDDLIGLVVPDDPPGLVQLVQQLVALRNATEYQVSVAAAQIDRLGIANASGSTTSKLLQANGVAPGVAARWLRIGSGLSGMDRTAGYFRDGFLSTEHIDAVVKGRAHVITRSEVEMSDDDRADVERKLLSQAISGANPGEIENVTRALGNSVAKDSGGTPPAEEPLLNRFDFVVREGRVVGEFDLDSVIGEKLHSALDLWSKPRPEPDGSRDRRSGAHWQHGGKTTLHNGCLLCKTCHQAVHNTDWDVIMGADGHPWLIPPADIDSRRRPLPAYNRRTLTLAA